MTLTAEVECSGDISNHSYLLVTDTTASVSPVGAGSVVCVAEKVAEILKVLEELIGGVLVHVDDFRRFNIVNDNF